MKRIIEASAVAEGKTLRILHDGQALLLCRVDDAVYATDDLCTHDDVSLSLGSLCEHRLRCPLHGSEFDVRSGAVLNEPAEQNLRTWPVTVVDGWICLSP